MIDSIASMAPGMIPGVIGMSASQHLSVRTCGKWSISLRKRELRVNCFIHLDQCFFLFWECTKPDSCFKQFKKGPLTNPVQACLKPPAALLASPRPFFSSDRLPCGTFHFVSEVLAASFWCEGCAQSCVFFAHFFGVSCICSALLPSLENWRPLGPGSAEKKRHGRMRRYRLSSVL